MAGNNVRIAATVQDAASGPIGKISRSMNDLEKQSGPTAGAFGRVGAAAHTMALVGIGAAVAAVGAFAVALAAGVKGALDEEVGIERLNVALANNVAGFDGNTEAIEKVIDARTRLAFDDGALRDSLSSLVTRTGDVTAALDLQAIAMDLARAKGIDLSTASDIVGKVYSGNVGILSRYGIAVEKGASATEALAQIQAATSGQAEAYGKTTKGAFEAFNVAINNVFEDLGSALLPALTDLATFLTESLIPTVKDIIAAIGDWYEDNKVIIDQIVDFTTRVLSGFFDILSKVATFIGQEVIPRIAALASALWENGLRQAFEAVTAAVGFVVDAVTAFANWIQEDTQMEVLRKIAAGLAEGFGLARDAVGFVIGRLSDLASWISTNGGDLLGFISSIGAFLSGRGDILINNALDGRASGGPVTAGQAYIVGERGPELFVPGSSGGIVPNGALGGGGGATINVNVQGILDAQVAERVAGQLEQALVRALRRGRYSTGVASGHSHSMVPS